MFGEHAPNADPKGGIRRSTGVKMAVGAIQTTADVIGQQTPCVRQEFFALSKSQTLGTAGYAGFERRFEIWRSGLRRSNKSAVQRSDTGK